MNLKTDIIYSTKEYTQFKFDSRNRKIKTKSKAFQALSESISKYQGLINPIIIDEDYVVVDGQHRLYACQLLGIAATYVYRPKSLVAMASLNNDRTNWTIDNFVNSHIGKPSYNKLMALKEKTGLSYNAVHALLTGKEIESYQFKKGNFSMKESEEVRFNRTWKEIEKIILFMQENMSDQVKKIVKTRVISTLGRLVNHSKYDSEVFIRGLSKTIYLASVNTQESAETMLLNIYNKHLPNKNKITSLN